MRAISKLNATAKQLDNHPERHFKPESREDQFVSLLPHPYLFITWLDPQMHPSKRRQHLESLLRHSDLDLDLSVLASPKSPLFLSSALDGRDF